MIRQKIMLVYYGADFLPYKDKARTTHYPMVGNVITGENNVRVIYFDTSAIGGAGDITWIANIEKPDGGRFYRILQEVTNEEGETFIALELSDLYTDVVGNIKIGLSGYFGQFALNENPETEEIEISGQPQIIATGCIQIGINYTPVVLPMGGRLTHSVEQQILGLLAQAVLSKETFVILDNIATTALTSYDSTQLFFDRTTNNFYKKMENPLVPYQKVTLGDLATHVADHTNPHQVTKAQVGLSNVDNTSDLNKPLSTAMVEALAEKIGADIIVDNFNTPNDSTIPTTKAVKTLMNDFSAFYITKNAQGDAFETYAELESATTFYSGGEVRTPTRNDYCYVRADEEHENATTKYSYQNGQWEFEVLVNETPLTQEQLDALNSGITAELVAKLENIDLSNYVAKTTTIAGVNLQDNITEQEMHTALHTLRKPITETHSGTTFSGSLASYDTHLFTDNLTSLTITALSVASGDEEPMWLIDFKTGATFTFTATPTIVWNGGTPTFSANKHYTLVIRKSGSEYLGTWLEF